MPNENEIIAPSSAKFSIPKTASGLVTEEPPINGAGFRGNGGDGTSDGDKSPEEMLAAAEREIAEREAKKTGEKKDAPVADAAKIQALTAKAQKDMNSLTDEEADILIKAGILKDDGNTESEEGKADKEAKEKEIQAKLDELAKKKPEELTDEDKKFIEENNPEPTPIEAMMQAYSQDLGMEIKGTYTNDTAGAIQLANDVAKLKVQMFLEQELKGNPKLKDFYQHFVVEGRSTDTFLARKSEPAFKGIKIEEVNESNSKEQNDAIINTQKKALELYYQSKGIAKDDYNMIIEGLEDSGKLFEKSKEARNILEKEYKTNIEKQLAEEEAAIKAEEEAVEKHWNTVRETLKKNSFYNGFKIPATDHAAFMDAILTPVSEGGPTKMQVLAQKNMTLEKQLLLDYIIFKDFKVNGLTASSTTSGARHLSFKNSKEDNADRRVPSTGSTVQGADSAAAKTLRKLDFKQVITQ